MSPANVLVVEDDPAIGPGLVRALRDAGYVARLAATGAQALTTLECAPGDLVLLDLGLPDVDGVEVCRRLRDRWPDLRIVVLSARTAEIEILVGLDAGADDYLIKPFRLAELLARVRAHLRRPIVRDDDEPLVVGDLRIDVGAHRVWQADEELELRAKEFDLLVFLVRHVGQALTRERIMTEVWDEHWFGSTKTLDMHISAVRRKIGDRDQTRITTIRGVGYRFEDR